MSRNLNIPESLIRQACCDLYARQLNAGCWPKAEGAERGNIPDSLHKIREIYGFDEDDPSWVIVIETVIKDNAVMLIARES